MSYIQCAVIPVPLARREAYLTGAKSLAQAFLDAGASRSVDLWGVDVPDGVVTDFRKAVQATADETVVVSLLTWPDKAAADAGQARAMADPRMAAAGEIFDLKRMIFAGFTPLFDTGA